MVRLGAELPWGPALTPKGLLGRCTGWRYVSLAFKPGIYSCPGPASWALPGEGTRTEAPPGSLYPLWGLCSLCTNPGQVLGCQSPGWDLGFRERGSSQQGRKVPRGAAAALLVPTLCLWVWGPPAPPLCRLQRQGGRVTDAAGIGTLYLLIAPALGPPLHLSCRPDLGTRSSDLRVRPGHCVSHRP